LVSSVPIHFVFLLWYWLHSFFQSPFVPPLRVSVPMTFPTISTEGH
jgi:hypothetical protein